jgi:hypothetical protein
MKDNPGPTHLIADFIAKATYRSLPGAAVQTAKMSIIDGIGTCLAGSASDAGRIITDYARERWAQAGNPLKAEGTGDKLPVKLFLSHTQKLPADMFGMLTQAGRRQAGPGGRPG